MNFYNYCLQRRWLYLMDRYNCAGASATCGGGGGAHSQGTSGLAGGIHGVGSTISQQQGAHNAGGIPGIGFQQHETHNAGGIHEVGPSSFQQHGTYNAGGIHGVGSATFQQQGTHNAGGIHGVGSTNTGIHNFPSDNRSNPPYYMFLPENSSNPPLYPDEGTWCLFCLNTVRGYLLYERRPYCGHYYHVGCPPHFPYSDFKNCFLCSMGISATEL